MSTWIRRLLSGAVITLSLSMLAAGPSLSRDPVPAPPGGGAGETIYLPDDRPDLGGGASGSRIDPVDPPAIDPEAKYPVIPDQIGGDDLIIYEHLDATDVSMDIAENGDIYVAVNRHQYDENPAITVLRSTDHGLTFSVWGVLGDGVSPHFSDGQLQIVEGTVDRCLVVYKRWSPGLRGEIHLAWSSLGDGALWTTTTVLADPSIDFANPRFDTDVDAYAAYYVYVVAEAWDDTGTDIWFARSIDQGASFETGYPLAELSYDDRGYRYPDISYGFGGRLHASWHFESVDGSFDKSVRYRRAASFASGGLSDWEYWTALTSTSNGMDEGYVRIEGSKIADELMIIYERLVAPSIYEPGIVRSTDGGANWGDHVLVEDGPSKIGDLLWNPGDGGWLVGGLSYAQAALWTAPAADPTSMTGPTWFCDREYGQFAVYWPGIAVDPTHAYRVAMAWNVNHDTPDWGREIYFDAAWQDDPGYPNLEPGFPLALDAAPLSPPALVDVDGDPELEIVFSDDLNRIQVLDPDGTSVSGWPVGVGATLSDGPVAVGDLNGDGVPILVVGATDGQAYAYDAAGQLMPGWPSAIAPAGNSVYVSIGAVGGPYQRTVVCAAQKYVTFRNRRGVAPAGTYGWSIGSGTQDIEAPPAIGDVDDDGISEVVAVAGNRAVVIQHLASSLDAAFTLPAPVADAVTLGDLDSDGDLELLFPGEDGILYAYDHDGTPHGGSFPFDSGTGSPLTSAALAHMIGMPDPEIAVASRDWQVHMLLSDGAQNSGWPQGTGDFWYVWDAPVIACVEGVVPDVVIGSRDKSIWAWTYQGLLHEGWPEDVGAYVYLSPAVADIDLDGAAEVVVLSAADMRVFDTATAPLPDDRTWPMYGHDPQRTGCDDCPEDVTTGIGADPAGGAITRVRFAAPSPNPVIGTTTFQFALPARAVVRLSVFDLRGRRVSRVFREEIGAGVKTVVWHGRDDEGRALPSGQYLARLSVRGPGMDQELVRKVMILR